MSPIFRAKEPCIPSKRALYFIEKSPVFHPKEPFVAAKDDTETSPECCMIARDQRDAGTYRDLYAIEKRPIFYPKKTYFPFKSLIFHQKEPCVASEDGAEISLNEYCMIAHDKGDADVSRDLYAIQKRPICHPKEPCVTSKRALCCI